MAELDYNQPIVLDNGSGVIKCGLSGMDRPCISYSNILGTPKYHKIKYLPSDVNYDDTFVGNQAQLKRGLLKLRYPIDHGVVEDWNSLELIWQQVLLHDLVEATSNENNGDEFKLRDHILLLTEHPFNPRKQREKMCELLFESFDLGAVNIAIPSVLSLYSTGRTTGCVVDVGDGVTCVSPIFDGFVLPNSIQRINIAGRDITRQLQLEVMKDGYSLFSSSEFEILRSLKERLSFIKPSHSSISEFENSYQDFILPDGKKMHIRNSSMVRSTELLFDAEIYGFEDFKLHEKVYESINKTDLDLREKLFETIVLSGGSTMFKNFGSRLINELKGIDSEVKLKMFSSANRKHSCFIGGSILSSLSTFKNIVISKKQFLEDSSCVYDKYF